MNRTLKRTCMLAVVLWIPLCSLAQNTIGLRYPVFARMIISNRTFSPPELDANIQDITFKPQRVHSIGLGFGLDMHISEPSREKVSWQINTGMYFFSAPLKYSAYQSAIRHNLDKDINWTYERYASGLEGSLGISMLNPIKERWFLRLGAGVNVQDIFINQFMLQARTTVVQDGQASGVEVVSAPDNFFNPQTRSEQNIRLNGVYTVGFLHRMADGGLLGIDFRICNAKQAIEEPFNLTFGDSGTLKYRKSFVGLDLSLVFPINKRLAFEL